MRKIVLALVMMVVGITAFASTKFVGVYNSDYSTVLITREEDDNPIEEAKFLFYDTDGDLIQADLTNGKFYVFVNGLAARSTYLELNETIEQWDKYSKLAYSEIKDDDGNVIGYTLAMAAKEGHIYAIQIYEGEVY